MAPPITDGGKTSPLVNRLFSSLTRFGDNEKAAPTNRTYTTVNSQRDGFETNSFSGLAGLPYEHRADVVSIDPFPSRRRGEERCDRLVEFYETGANTIPLKNRKRAGPEARDM